MKRPRFLTLLLILILLVTLIGTVVAATPRSASAQSNVHDDGGGDYTDSMLFDGLERTYRFHIPPSFDETQPPLVFALHGGGGTSEGMIRLTLNGLNDLADKDSFIVVYPDGVENNWNDGREGASDRAHEENINDVGFISALIDHFIQTWNVNPKRVYITGMSNGAMMSLRMACESSERVAAIAPVAGSIPESIVPHCSPLKPVPVLMINGIDDPIVPWEGGDITGPFGYTHGRVISVNSAVGFWVNRDHCLSVPLITEEPDRDPQDGTRVRREAHSEGIAGTEVILYAVEGGGHTWPGGHSFLPEGIVGKTSRDISANQVIWDFFKEHTLNFTLHATAAAETIRLTWAISGSLPVTSTWQIAYDPPNGDQPSPITGIVSTTRAYTLTGLTNYVWYTVTLNAMLDSTAFLTETARVMPTDIFVYLPFILRAYGP